VFTALEAPNLRCLRFAAGIGGLSQLSLTPNENYIRQQKITKVIFLDDVGSRSRNANRPDGAVGCPNYTTDHPFGRRQQTRIVGQAGMIPKTKSLARMQALPASDWTRKLGADPL
jgi:hypothetical protein